MPQVSVIIITTAKRAAFFKQCEKYLARQTFQDFEIIVDKTDKSIPEKRNNAISLSKTDRLIIIDDDDFQFDDRIEKQCKVLNSSMIKMCATSHYYSWSIPQQKAKEYTNPTGIFGMSLAFHKSIWEHRPFNENWLRLSDAEFILYHLNREPTCLLDMRDPSIAVYTIHGDNISGRFINGKESDEITARVKQIFGSDYDAIQSLRIE
jgi:hypothetical protein